MNTGWATFLGFGDPACCGRILGKWHAKSAVADDARGIEYGTSYDAAIDEPARRRIGFE